MNIWPKRKKLYTKDARDMRCHTTTIYAYNGSIQANELYYMVYSIYKARTAEHGDDFERERRFFFFWGISTKYLEIRSARSRKHTNKSSWIFYIYKNW